MRGRDCIYRRKNRKGLTARIRIEGQYRYGTFDTKAHAEAWLQQERAEAAEAKALGLPVLAQKTSFKRCATAWLRSLKATKTPKTIAGYSSIVKAVLVPAFGDRLIHEISVIDIDDFVAKRGDAGVKPATINRNLTVLSQIFKRAKRRRVVRQDPTIDVKRTREEIDDGCYLDGEAEARLFAALPPWLQVPVLLALETGLRASEIAALTRRDVDLRRSLVTVRKSKNKQPRHVELTSRLHDALAMHLKTIPRGATSLFFHPDGRAFDVGVYRPDWESAVNRAEVSPLRFHDLRHACGTRLAEGGAPPAVIKAVLGHKTMDATLRYIRHMPADLSRNAARYLQAARDLRDAASG